MNKRIIKNRVREWDNEKWREEMDALSSIGIYRHWKRRIREERCYDNTEASAILFGARSNALRLNNRKRHGGGGTTCDLCGVEMEDLGHFLLRCHKLEGKRRRELFGLPNREDDEIIGEMLFSGERIQEVKEMLGKMWRERERGRRIMEIERDRVPRG